MINYINGEWLPVLAGLAEKGESSVLVTVIAVRGSAPREVGAKMVITAEKQFGTIGGGNLEFESTAEARKLLHTAAAPTVKEYPLGPRLAQCCGGAVSIFLEPFVAPRTKIYLFGAGHVGKEVVKVLDGLPVRIKWIDERAGEFPEALPDNCEKISTATPVDALPDSLDNAFIVIMTHQHELDYHIVRAALQKGGYAYLGLIGSKAKSIKFRKRLQGEGLDGSSLVCPIGMPGIKGKHPRTIAISLAAQLLSLEPVHADSLPHNTPFIHTCSGCPNESKCG